MPAKYIVAYIYKHPTLRGSSAYSGTVSTWIMAESKEEARRLIQEKHKGCDVTFSRLEPK